MTENRKTIIRNIWLVIQGILVSASFCIFHGIKTSSVASGAILAMYILLFQKSNVALTQKEKKVKYIFAFVFSMFTVLGELPVIIASEYMQPWALTLLICWCGQFFLMGLILEYLLVILRRNYFVNAKMVQPTCKKRIKIFGLCMTVLLFVWGIGWIKTYPGSMSRDSIQIANMALGNIELNAAVPIVYIMPIRFFWKIGEGLFGTANAGLALCTLVQTISCAAIVSYTITRLYAAGIRKGACTVILLYFALLPYNTYMVTTIWKDVPFAASTLLFSSLLFDLYMGMKAQSKFAEYGKLAAFVLAGMGMCLMRNNGLYAFLLFIPFGIFVFWKKNKQIVLAIVLIFLCTRVVQGPVYDRIMTSQAQAVAQKEGTVNGNPKEKADAADNKEKEVKNATDNYNNSAIYTITMQQLANVAVDRPDLSSEDYERLDKVIKVEEIRAIYAEKPDYCRRCIDPTIALRRFGASQSEYLKTWVYFGMKYPINYILGWRGQTWGYWYPDIQNWTTIDDLIENDLGLYKEPVISDNLKWKLQDWESLYKKIPGYGLLWSIGFVMWTTMFFAGIAYIRKGLRAAMLYIPLIGIWLTLLVATPIYAEFRYMYSIYWCLPLAILFPFTPQKEEKN